MSEGFCHSVRHVFETNMPNTLACCISFNTLTPTSAPAVTPPRSQSYSYSHSYSHSHRHSHSYSHSHFSLRLRLHTITRYTDGVRYACFREDQKCVKRSCVMCILRLLPYQLPHSPPFPFPFHSHSHAHSHSHSQSYSHSHPSLLLRCIGNCWVAVRGHTVCVRAQPVRHEKSFIRRC